MTKCGGVGVQDALRIAVGGELHAFGGLSGRLLDKDEAASLVSMLNV
jgi:hypothetical protein